LLGFIAGWHHDFDAKQAAILNRMVMLQALPLSLFAGMAGMARNQVLSRASGVCYPFGHGRRLRNCLLRYAANRAFHSRTSI
jgi:hypothetical protein